MKSCIKILRISLNVLSLIILIFAVIALLTVLLLPTGDDSVPSLFGKTFLTVRSSSMEPVIRQGDLIAADLLSEDEKNTLTEGDIITFYTDLNGDGREELNTHTIVAVNHRADGQTYYTTRDENNPTDDAYAVPQDKVLGRYLGLRIGGVGHVSDFVRSPMGMFLCIVLPSILFFGYTLINFITVAHSLKSEKRSAAEEEEIKRRAVEEYIRRQNECRNEVK